MEPFNIDSTTGLHLSANFDCLISQMAKCRTHHCCNHTKTSSYKSFNKTYLSYIYTTTNDGNVSRTSCVLFVESHHWRQLNAEIFSDTRLCHGSIKQRKQMGHFRFRFWQIYGSIKQLYSFLQASSATATQCSWKHVIWHGVWSVICLRKANVSLQQQMDWAGLPHRGHTHTHTHIRLTALFPGLPRWAGTRKVEPI